MKWSDPYRSEVIKVNNRFSDGGGSYESAFSEPAFWCLGLAFGVGDGEDHRYFWDGFGGGLGLMSTFSRVPDPPMRK